MKVCTKCKSRKDENQFHKHSSTKDGLNTVCKECIKGYRTGNTLKRKGVKGSTKRCNTCGKWLPFNNFHKDKKRGYLMSPCKECRKNLHRAQYKKKREVLVKGDKRKCTKCSNWLKESINFYKIPKSGKYNTACINCSQEYYRNKRAKVLYGLNEGEYRKLLEAQEYKCAICGEENGKNKNGTKKSLCIDHCHETGKVRGLLCDNCNTGLGKFKDNVQLLKNSIFYLKKLS